MSTLCLALYSVSAYEVKNNNCLFGRLFKVKKNGVFLFGKSFIILEIFRFLYYANEKQNDTYYIVAVATPLAPVSFCEKTNIPVCNLFEWDRGSSSEQTWCPHCFNSSIRLLGVDDPCVR